MSKDEIKDGMRMDYGTPIYRHRGYDIRFNENSEMWSVSSLNIEATQLSIAKEMVNKLDKEARTLEEHVPCIIVHDYGSTGPRNCMVTMIDADKKGAWVVALADEFVRGQRNKVEKREKVTLENLVLDTPEARAAIDAFTAAEAEATRIARERREFLKSLPRMTMPELKPVEALTEAQSQKVAARPARKRSIY